MQIYVSKMVKSRQNQGGLDKSIYFNDIFKHKKSKEK